MSELERKYRKALEECRDELDSFYRDQYPGDHPHFVAAREHLIATNPARKALEAKT